MKAVIYARYSAGPKQTDQSIDGQVRVCRKYCEDHGMEVVDIYADRHITGKTDARPEFQRMIRDSAFGKFDAVCVYKTDRFSRNKLDSVVYKKQLKDNGVKLCYAAEAIPEGPEGIILESLMEGLAEYYSAELAQKIRRGMYETALKGKPLGNNIPFGYTTDENRCFVIDEDEAQVVRMIYDMYLRGNNVAEIRRKLTSLGYTSRVGRPFAYSSLKRILTNEAYTGTYKAVGVRIEGNIPAIISKETFAMAQIKVKKTKELKGRMAKDIYLLSGKLYCGKCDRLMSGASGRSHTGKAHHYYRCPGHYKYHECPRKPIVRDDLENLVVQMTVDYVLNPKVMREIAHIVFMTQSDALRNDKEEDRLEAALRKNKKEIRNLIDAIKAGFRSDELSKELDQLEERKIDLENELAAVKQRSLGLSEDQIYFFLEQFIKRKEETPHDYRKKVIECFVSSVYVYDDTIEIYYKMSDQDHHSSGKLGSTPLPSVDLTVLRSNPDLMFSSRGLSLRIKHNF